MKKIVITSLVLIFSITIIFLYVFKSESEDLISSDEILSTDIDFSKIQLADDEVYYSGYGDLISKNNILLEFIYSKNNNIVRNIKVTIKEFKEIIEDNGLSIERTLSSIKQIYNYKYKVIKGQSTFKFKVKLNKKTYDLGEISITGLGEKNAIAKLNYILAYEKDIKNERLFVLTPLGDTIINLIAQYKIQKNNNF
jgi:hypothetical protein